MYVSFHLKFVNKSTSKNHESVLSKFMQFIAQRSLFCVFPSRAVKPLRPLLLHRQDAVAVTIACCLKLENNLSVLKCYLTIENRNIAKGTTDPRVEFISQNLDKASTSKPQPTISISTKVKILTKPSFRILTKIQLQLTQYHSQASSLLNGSQ